MPGRALKKPNQESKRRSEGRTLWTAPARGGGKQARSQAKASEAGIEKRYIFAPLELDATYPGCYASYEVNC
jgi:hypothetical protein